MFLHTSHPRNQASRSRRNAGGVGRIPGAAQGCLQHRRTHDPVSDRAVRCLTGEVGEAPRNGPRSRPPCARLRPESRGPASHASLPVSTSSTLKSPDMANLPIQSPRRGNYREPQLRWPMPCCLRGWRLPAGGQANHCTGTEGVLTLTMESRRFATASSARLAMSPYRSRPDRR